MTGYTFPQLIDFTRTSAATFVNSSGNIASTPQSRNLLTFTQEFDNAAWAKVATTITANNTTAPDGTSTADLATQTGVGYVQQQATAGTGTFTASVYLKAGTLTWARLSIFDSAHREAWFNLATGAVGASGSGVTAAITSAGNGWYRCTVTYATGASNPFLSLYFTNANSGSALNGTGFIWGAQLEQASAATDYTRNFGGLFPPRFDYDPVTRAPRGLLIEEQRTNLFTRSEEFDNAAWSKSGATITANAATSPDGTVDADRFNATSPGGMDQSVVLVNGTSYTISVWAKSNGASKDTFILYGDGNQTSGVFTATGTWQRFSYTFTSLNSAARGNGVFTNGANDCDILLWGAQLEAGAFATSYIPTVASQVTRAADVAEIGAPNFAPWYNQSEGTFVVEGATLSAGNTYRALAVTSDAAYQSRVDIGIGTGSGGSAGRFRDDIVVSGSVQAALGDFAAFAAETPYKNALAYKANDFASATSGANLATDASGTVPTVALLDIGNRNGSNQLNGWVRSIRYYPTRLTNAQLQALTA